MKKLITICFSFIFVIISLISIWEFTCQSDATILEGKVNIVIEEKGDLLAKKLTELVGSTFKEQKIDIMLKEVTKDGAKYIRKYYKTDYDPDFIDILGTAPKDGECITTVKQEGYDCKELPLSNLKEEIIIFNWSEAEKKNLKVYELFVPEDKASAVVDIFKSVGVEALTPRDHGFSDGNMRSFYLTVLIFPVSLIWLAVLLYVLLSAKKYVLLRMEGFSSGDIISREVKTIALRIFVSFAAVWTCGIIAAKIIFNTSAFSRYLANIGGYLQAEFWIIFITFLILIISAWPRNSVNYIKGKAPHRAAYATTVAFRVIFLIVIIPIVPNSIYALREAHDKYCKAQKLEEKAANYVTLEPLHYSEAAYMHQLEAFVNKNYDQFRKLYQKTSEENGAILIKSSNYQRVMNMKSLAEAIGQDTVEINVNYLNENLVVAENGERIKKESLDKNKPYAIFPKNKIYKKNEYNEKFFKKWFTQEANILIYDPDKSRICSYNPRAGDGVECLLKDPVLVINDIDSLTESGYWKFFYIPLGNKYYFIKTQTDDPVAEFTPMLRELFDWEFEIKSLAESFYAGTVDNMGLFYSSLVILILLVMIVICFSFASAKIYCENYKKKICQALIDGFSLWRCVKSHLIGIVITHMGLAMGLTLLLGIADLIWYAAITGILLTDLLISLALCAKYSRANLQKILKGSDV